MKDVLEIQADAIQKGQKVVVIDDLLATGGKSIYLSCVMLLSNMSLAVSLTSSTGEQLVFTKKKDKKNILNLNFFTRRTFFEMVKSGPQALSPLHSQSVCLV